MIKPPRVHVQPLAGALFLALLAVLTTVRVLPRDVFAMYLVLSAVSFVLYGADKAASRKGEWRTRESTLHVLALAGGWPGALIAQHVFRHKTTKQPFRRVFWATAAGNSLLLATFAIVCR